MQTKPQLSTGYAYQSSRRHPKEPQHVVVSDSQDGARYVGVANIDGQRMSCFKVPNKSRYYFQITF